MPVITNAKGRVVAWGGEVTGHVEGSDSPYPKQGRFEADYGVGEAENRKVHITVLPEAMLVCGFHDTENQLEVARKCVARYFVQLFDGGELPAIDARFTIDKATMERLKAQLGILP